MLTVFIEDRFLELGYSRIRGRSSMYEEPLNKGKNIDVSEIKRKEQGRVLINDSQ